MALKLFVGDGNYKSEAKRKLDKEIEAEQRRTIVDMFHNLRFASKSFSILPKMTLFGKIGKLFEGYGTSLVNNLQRARM